MSSFHIVMWEITLVYRLWVRIFSKDVVDEKVREVLQTVGLLHRAKKFSQEVKWR